MQLTEENRRDILNLILQQVAGIADKEYQKRVWIGGQGPEVDDFDETTNTFIHETEEVLENYKLYNITEPQYRLLLKFRNEFDAFAENNYWPPEFIDNSEWARIMNMAKEVLVAFAYHKPQENMGKK